MKDIEKDELSDIISDESRIAFEPLEPRFLSDSLGRLKGRADALVLPVSTKEVSQILRYAWEHEIPVTPRGAGTNLVGSTVPMEGGSFLIYPE